MRITDFDTAQLDFEHVMNYKETTMHITSNDEWATTTITRNSMD